VPKERLLPKTVEIFNNNSHNKTREIRMYRSF
jgi:hypothetical protein